MLQSIFEPTRGACMTMTNRLPGCFCITALAVLSLVTSRGMSGATGAKSFRSGTLRTRAWAAAKSIAMRIISNDFF